MAASSLISLPKFLTSLLSSPSPSPSLSPPPSLVSLPNTTALVRPHPSTTIATVGPTSCNSIAAVVSPSLAHSNTLFFNSAYNVQVIAGENEPEEKLLNRFRKEVFRAGVLQECRRRRFFESSQDKRKRKSRDAARRNRKRPPGPPKSKAPTKAKQETTNMKKDDEEDDNWDNFDVDLPY